MTTLDAAKHTTAMVNMKDVLMAVADWQRAASKNLRTGAAEKRARAAIKEVLLELTPFATDEDVEGLIQRARVGEV